MAQPLRRRALLMLGAVAVGAAGGLVSGARAPSPERPTDQQLPLGDLALRVRADPWRLSLLAPSGDVLWDEPADETLSYQTADGRTYRARRLTSFNKIRDGVA